MASELERLIEQQSGDDASDHVQVPCGSSVRPVHHGTPLDAMPDDVLRRHRPRLVRSGELAVMPEDHDWIYLSGGPWPIPLRFGLCPVCMGSPRELAYCLWCDRTGMDHANFGHWPGLPVDTVITEDETTRTYRAQPRYLGTGRLKGGKGA